MSEVPLLCKLEPVNCGPLSEMMDSEIPCSANNSFRCVIVFAAVHWDVGIFQVIVILE